MKRLGIPGWGGRVIRRRRDGLSRVSRLRSSHQGGRPLQGFLTAPTPQMAPFQMAVVNGLHFLPSGDTQGQDAT